MNYLAYTPSCELYIASNNNGEVKYYDVSEDISSMSVVRNVNNPSTFSVVLSNKNRKYNGLFKPMDRVAIFATKTERYRLLTGYITSVDVFTLYSGDFKMSGLCSLYQLQEKFWDPGLEASQSILAIDDAKSFADAGYWQPTYKMLNLVAGWRDDQIRISEAIPDSVIQWASEMYAAQKGDIEQAESVLKAFDKTLKEHGPSFSSAGGVAGGSDGAESGGVNLSADEAKASADQKAIVSKAVSGSVGGQYGWCLKWVGDVYQAAGFPFARYWGAVDVWRQRKSHVAYGDSKTGIPLGACVVTTGTPSGNGAGHIGIYIGGGMVISEVGGQRKESVEQFSSWGNWDTIDGRQGWLGWVCPKCSPAMKWS